MHRTLSTRYGYNGFELVVTDHPTWRWLVEAGVDRLVAMLGHPCCGHGLGRIPSVATGAYHLINWAGHVGDKHSTVVVRLSLTTAQALALNIYWQDSIRPGGWITVDGADEDGDVYKDARLVAVKCPDCGRLIPAEGRWQQAVLDEHMCDKEA